MTNPIEQTIVRLFQTERFYAEIISQMRRIISTRVPIAGVRVTNTIELFLNPETFCSYPIETRAAILKHECEHILRDHISRCKSLAPEVYSKSKDLESDVLSTMKHRSLNIAADCAINGILKDLPKEGVFPKDFDLKNGETLEWYLDQLKDNEKAKGFMEFDGHDLWNESEGSDEMIKEKIKIAINKAAKRTRAAGMMTSDHELLVSELNREVTVDWRY